MNNPLLNLAIAIVALTGCQALAGVEDRAVDPVLTGCTMPRAGEANVRLTNLVPDDAAIDVCVRPSGGNFGRPILRGGGSACPAGFKYAQASARFGVQAGTIDVKVIAAGGTCSAPALSSMNKIAVPKGSMTTLVHSGNDKLGKSLNAYPESTVTAPGRAKFRVIHASPGSPPLSFGIATTARLPAEIKTPLLLAPLAYGEASNAQSKSTFGNASAEGYIEVPATPINLGAAPVGASRAVLVAPLPGNEAGRTIYVVGDPAKPYFPVRALVCDDLDNETPLLNRCAPSPLGTISVDTFNAFLFGSFADFEAERRPYVIDALAKRDADLLCITGISRKADRDNLIATAKEKGTFAYSIAPDSNLDTPPTDPRDQSGATPKPYTIPACGGTVPAGSVDAVMSCLLSNCSTTGTLEGELKGGSSCMSSACAGQFIPLLAGDHDQKRCFNCLIISSLSGETHGETKTTCNTDIRDYKAFKGQTDSLVLSRFPLSDVETYYFPTTGYQRAMHYAKVAIERDKSIDFFCSELSPSFGSLVPYHGAYAPNPDADPWSQEQLLQAKQVIDFVKKKSGTTRPAIITGDWSTSEAYTSPDGSIKIDDQNGAVIDLLNKSLVPALPPGFAPRCTECATPANPYNGDLNIWQLRTYFANLPASSAVEAGLFFTDFVVPLPTGAKGPLSDRFGFEVRVLRP